MSVAIYSVSTRCCATCRWWGGVRSVDIAGAKPKPIRVRADITPSDCMALKRKTRPGDLCSRYSIWEKLQS